ncbi:MAG: hypothetical protein M3R68_10510, partial [Acidobacteriota bacterium]|nr:hypothetical protein [Acidobacteriota bacterium]
LELVDKIVNAVLYEGYMLYPYRPSAVKNRQRWNFGVLYPQSYSETRGGTEATSMQTECLMLVNDATVLEVRIRFLHLVQRQIGKVSESAAQGHYDSAPDYQAVESLEVDGQRFQSWQEAIEREVVVPAARLRDLEAEPQHLTFGFPAQYQFEPLSDKSGRLVGVIVRHQELVTGEISLSAKQEGDGLSKITVKISNRTALDDVSNNIVRSDRDLALLCSTVSTHTILGVTRGEFVSQLDPPEHLRAASSTCNNAGTWPVLVGAEGATDTMLSSPIILYDYPQIAPESAGNLFDGTEIDEILTLRIMTMTEEEKREMRGADDRARQILERTETLPIEQLMKMHGAVRGLKAVSKK